MQWQTQIKVGECLAVPGSIQLINNVQLEVKSGSSPALRLVSLSSVVEKDSWDWQ